MPAADQADIARAEYEGYTRNALVQLRRVRQGHADRRRPHAQPPDGRALADGQHEGDRDARRATARRSTSWSTRRAFREGVGQAARRSPAHQERRRLCRRRRSCSTPTASTSIRSCATRSSRACEALKLPSYTGFVHAEARGRDRCATATITDVKISYPQDLTKQMLEWSAQTRDSRAQLIKR